MVDLVCCGAINWDINLFMKRLPKQGEEVQVIEIHRVSGGTAANVSVAAARILGEGKVGYIGALGDDNIAEKQIQILQDEGVDITGITIFEDEESGQAYISISEDGENEIHTYFGANLHLNPDIIKQQHIMNLIKKAKLCVIMDPPLQTAKKLAEICEYNDVIVVWDPGVYVEEGLSNLQPILNYTDYFILNQQEFNNLLGTNDPLDVSKFISEAVEDTKIIIKQGSKGCTIYQKENHYSVKAIPLEFFGMKVINTVGCGDAFIGGFSSAKVNGLDDAEALRWGNAAGAYKATKKETRGAPSLHELKSLLNRWRS